MPIFHRTASYMPAITLGVDRWGGRDYDLAGCREGRVFVDRRRKENEDIRFLALSNRPPGLSFSGRRVWVETELVRPYSNPGRERFCARLVHQRSSVEFTLERSPAIVSHRNPPLSSGTLVSWRPFYIPRSSTWSVYHLSSPSPHLATMVPRSLSPHPMSWGHLAELGLAICIESGSGLFAVAAALPLHAHSFELPWKFG